MELLPGPRLFSVSQTASQQIKGAAGGTSQRTAQLWNWNDTLTRELPSFTLSWIQLSVQGVFHHWQTTNLVWKTTLNNLFRFCMKLCLLAFSHRAVWDWVQDLTDSMLPFKHNMQRIVTTSVPIILHRAPYLPGFFSSCLTNRILLNNIPFVLQK